MSALEHLENALFREKLALDGKIMSMRRLRDLMNRSSWEKKTEKQQKKMKRRLIMVENGIKLQHGRLQQVARALENFKIDFKNKLYRDDQLKGTQ